jgi:hypothetical protein
MSDTTIRRTYLHAGDAARYTGRSRSTIRDARLNGRLRGFQVEGHRGWWWYRKSDLDRYMQGLAPLGDGAEELAATG